MMPNDTFNLLYIQVHQQGSEAEGLKKIISQ